MLFFLDKETGELWVTVRVESARWAGAEFAVCANRLREWQERWVDASVAETWVTRPVGSKESCRIRNPRVFTETEDDYAYLCLYVDRRATKEEEEDYALQQKKQKEHERRQKLEQLQRLKQELEAELGEET